MHSVETRRFRNCLCVFLCFFFLVVLQILFSLFFRFFSRFRNLLWYVSASETFGRYKTREIRNFNQSSITKLGVRETFFVVILFCGCVSPCFSDSCSKNYFWCVFRLSTQILSSSTDMHQLRSFFFWFSLTFSFFSFERWLIPISFRKN